MNNERSVEYSQKIVIFFDILGFKDLIDNNTPGLIDDILRTVYLSSEQPFENCYSINFSDSIIQIFEPHRDMGGDEKSDFTDYVNNLLDAVQRAQNTLLLNYKVVIRGAMVLGDIYYNKETNTIFGPALNLAATLEEREAVYPRVILDESIVEKLDVKDNEQLVFYNYAIDDDGRYYADLFQYIVKTKYEKSAKLPVLKTKVEEIINEIKAREMNVEKKERIMDKYNWLIKKIEIRENEDFDAARERLSKK